MARPDKLPRWATDGGADVTEPSEGKKDVGWTVEKPPHEYFNWLHLRTYGWLAWLLDQVEPPTINYTQSGGKITQIDAAARRVLINYAGFSEITSIVLQEPPGTTIATYTPTYVGRFASTMTRS